MRALISLLLFVIPDSIEAQDPPPRIENLGVGCCRMRIWAVEGQAEGTFQGLRGTTRLTLSPCKGSLCPGIGAIDSTIAFQRNTAIEVYAGRAVEKGVKWGAAIGGLALTAYWLGREDLPQEDSGKIGGGMVLGGIAGAVIGGLIGALIPRWAPVVR